MFRYIYINIAPEYEFTLKKKALHASRTFASYIRDELDEGELNRTLPGLLKLREPKYSHDCIIAAMVYNVIATAPIFSRAVVSILNRLLDDPEVSPLNLQAEHHSREHICRVISDTDDRIVDHG